MTALANFLIVVTIAILSAVFPPLIAVLILYQLFFLVPGVAVAVRRLHDINRTGKWLIGFIATYCGVLAAAYTNNIELVYFMLAIEICYAVLMLYFHCKKGTEGENRYGMPYIQPSQT